MKKFKLEDSFLEIFPEAMIGICSVTYAAPMVELAL